jgi:DHA2 family multidrug resistance protein
VGVPSVTPSTERREQFHGLRLGEYLDHFNTAANSFIVHAQTFFSHQIADPAAGRRLGLQELENLRQQQASSLAYFDCFWVFAVLTFALVFVALCLKRSVAKEGANHAVE